MSEDEYISSSEDENEDTDEEISESDSKKPEMILAHRKLEDNSYEYYVKFHGSSYSKSEWHPEEFFNETNQKKMMLTRYKKMTNMDVDSVPPFYNPEYDEPEFIITEDDECYLVKWKGLDFNCLTWELKTEFDHSDKIQMYKNDNKLPSLEEMYVPPHPKESDFKEIKTHEKSRINGYSVRSYQLEGLNFLVKNWYCRTSPILADEMGLGKTLQSSIFLSYLKREQNIKGPFLVISPLSTIQHWERELREWTDFKILIYHGIRQRREIMKEYLFFYEHSSKTKFNVLITTYEYIIKEEQLFSSINWKCIIIDEAHRLKSYNSKLSIALRNIPTAFKVLLTGTPIQNNIDELWSLLNYLEPNEFNSFEEFQEEFGELKDKNEILELQKILKRFMLRRLKGDVEKTIAPLEEVIIECPMTSHQKAYYKSIFTKNMDYLTRGAHQNNSVNLRNISMELRKVCNHPYLIPGAEEQIMIERKELTHIDKDDSVPIDFDYQSLVRSAGKMILLDKLLLKLKKDKHRVLIFSQMTKMLDILHDYLTYKGYSFRRIDGSIRGDIRQKEIDEFNAPDSEDFVFLLCTKAGGLGINLTTADTVIIYDSDWNPQNDIQATARCHRIGQLKEVKVYRFITSKSYERKMFDRASMKLGLDHAVLESAKNEINTDDMEKLLRYGAYYAFEDDEEENNFNEEDIETVLSHSMTIRHENFTGGEGSTFSKAQFTIDEDEIDISAPDFWQKYTPEVVEDDIEDYGATIAERRKILREESNSSLSQESSQKKKDYSIFIWSKGKISSLQTRLYRYGWGRWKLICENGKFQCEIAEVRAVCRVILKWLIDSSEEKYPILELIYDTSLNPDYAKFEKKFAKKNYESFFPIISNGSSWKLNRLEVMYFLINYVSTCPNPPEGLILPELTGAMPAEWWTKEDDKTLLYYAWEKGFLQYDDIHFSKDEPINQKYLTLRIRSLVNGLKSIYIKYKQSLGTEIPFNFETIQESFSSWSKKEHRAVVRNLISFGYPGPEKFKEISEKYLSSKTNEQIDKYVQKVLEACNELKANKEFEQTELVEKIMAGTAQKLLSRVDIFSKIREIYDNKLCPENEKELVEYFVVNGFLNLNTSQIIIDKFGTECAEGKSIKYLKSIISKIKRNNDNQVQKNEKQDLQSLNSHYDENGSIIYPINLTQTIRILSLGKIVQKKQFCSNRYIYPDGFTSERLYVSLKNPNEKVWYTNKIIDIGEDAPRFRVELSDDPSIYFEASSPSNPWVCILKEIEKQKKILGIQKTKSFSISGPENFGLNNPLTMQLIQKMEGTKELLELCAVPEVKNKNNSKKKNQKRRKQEIESESESEIDNEIDYEAELVKEAEPPKPKKHRVINVPQIQKKNILNPSEPIQTTVPPKNNEFHAIIGKYNSGVLKMNPNIDIHSKPSEIHNLMFRYQTQFNQYPQPIQQIIPPVPTVQPVFIPNYQYHTPNHPYQNEMQNQYNQYVKKNQGQNEQKKVFLYLKK